MGEFIVCDLLLLEKKLLLLVLKLLLVEEDLAIIEIRVLELLGSGGGVFLKGQLYFRHLHFGVEFLFE